MFVLHAAGETTLEACTSQGKLTNYCLTSHYMAISLFSVILFLHSFTISEYSNFTILLLQYLTVHSLTASKSHTFTFTTSISYNFIESLLQYLTTSQSDYFKIYIFLCSHYFSISQLHSFTTLISHKFTVFNISQLQYFKISVSLHLVY